jgi:hypothetical protein
MTVYIITFYNCSWVAKLFWLDQEQNLTISADCSDSAVIQFFDRYNKDKYHIISIKRVI